MVKLDRIHLEQEGLGKFFSPIEVRILEILWRKPEITSSEIQKRCPDLSLPCVAGTLDRLTKSGFVERENEDEGGRARFLYSPATTLQETGIKISERIYESLVDTFGTSVMDAFARASLLQF